MAKSPPLPPRWVIRLAWAVHRGVCRVFGRRIGLWRPRAKGWGTLRLTTTGRRSGRERTEGEPAWWLNLQAQPEATVDLVDGRRPVRAYAATGDERTRLWDRWRVVDANLDAYAARRPSGTAVVVLAPRTD